MLDKLQSVTRRPQSEGLAVALVLGTVVGISGGLHKNYSELFSSRTNRRGPPYAHPEITPESLLRTAYELQPFFDIRREGAIDMLANIGESPSELLTALEAYRNEGNTIAPTGFPNESIAGIEKFIQWCIDRRLPDAANMARAILKKQDSATSNAPAIPVGEQYVF